MPPQHAQAARCAHARLDDALDITQSGRRARLQRAHAPRRPCPCTVLAPQRRNCTPPGAMYGLEAKPHPSQPARDTLRPRMAHSDEGGARARCHDATTHAAREGRGCQRQVPTPWRPGSHLRDCSSHPWHRRSAVRRQRVDKVDAQPYTRDQDLAKASVETQALPAKRSLAATTAPPCDAPTPMIDTTGRVVHAMCIWREVPRFRSRGGAHSAGRAVRPERALRRTYLSAEGARRA